MAAQSKIEIIIEAATAGFERSLRGAVQAVKGLDSAARQADRGGLSAARRGVESISRQLDVLRNAAITVFSVNTIRGFVSGIINLADKYTLLDARIGLVTSSAAEAAAVHQQLYEAANRSGSTFESTAGVYARFAQATQGMGISQAELITMTETLNKAFAISGSSTQETQGALVQLSQAFSAGVLRGQEFNSVSEQGARVINLLTDYLKVNRGELRLMAEKGELTADVLRNAIAAGAEQVNDEFNRMPVTTDQAANHLFNAFGEIVHGADKSTGATNSIASSIEKLATTVEQNKPGIIAFFSGIIEGAGWATERIINMVNAVRRLSAVGAGVLSIQDAATMTRKEFAEWDKDFGTVAGDLRIKIRKVSSELQALREGPGAPEKAAELRKLQDELAAYEAAAEKVSAGAGKLSGAQTEVAKKTALTSKELSDLQKDLLPVVVAQNRYREQLKAIAMAEKAGQFSKDRAENEKLAAAARKRAAQELEKARVSAEKFGQSARRAGKEWSAFGSRVRTVGKEFAAAERAAELAGTEKILARQREILGVAQAEAAAGSEKIRLLDLQIEKYRELRAQMPAGDKADEKTAELDEKINRLLVQRNELLIETNAARMRAASQERILALEREKIEASRLPTELARAEAELAIERRIMEERVTLKRQELETIKADREAGQADIIRAETALAEELVRNETSLNDRLRSLAAIRMDEIERMWRRGAASAQQYQEAVQAALAAGAIDSVEARERMIAAGDDLGAALALGFARARERLQTDAEMMIMIGEELGDRLSSGLASAWDGFISGTKSAGEAFADFARSTISWISQILLKQMLLKAFKSSGLFGGMAEGGAVEGFSRGGAVGGWSPGPTSDNIPAWLTAGEYVHPVRAVDYYGLAFMEQVRRLKFPRHLARALAGSTIPAIPAGHRLAQGGLAAAPAPAPVVRAGDTNLRVVNVLDRHLVSDYLRTAAGETVIVNLIKNNGAAIRAALGA
ncbi:MAG: tape measure protein [Desulfobulbus sp.]|jgi:tape measure domain-containing protein